MPRWSCAGRASFLLENWDREDLSTSRPIHPDRGRSLSEDHTRVPEKKQSEAIKISSQDFLLLLAFRSGRKTWESLIIRRLFEESAEDCATQELFLLQTWNLMQSMD